MSDRAARALLLRDQSGATALEFAIVLPVFLALVFAIFEFGMAQHRLASLRYAMNGISRAVMLNPGLTEAQISELVTAKLAAIADPNVTVTRATITTAAGKVVRLTGVYSSEIGIPTVATYPLSFTTTVDAALPDA